MVEKVDPLMAAKKQGERERERERERETPKRENMCRGLGSQYPLQGHTPV
jgi:hypothetical protein